MLGTNTKIYASRTHDRKDHICKFQELFVKLNPTFKIVNIIIL